MTYVYLTSYTQAKHLFSSHSPYECTDFLLNMSDTELGNPGGKKKKKKKSRDVSLVYDEHVPTILSCMSLEGQTCPPFSYVNGPNFNPNANIRYVASPTRLEIRTFIM